MAFCVLAQIRKPGEKKLLTGIGMLKFKNLFAVFELISALSTLRIVENASIHRYLVCSPNLWARYFEVFGMYYTNHGRNYDDSTFLLRTHNALQISILEIMVKASFVL